MNQTQPTRSSVSLRRADEADLDGLGTMLTGLSELSRWFRFQTALGTPPRPALLLRMLRPTGAAWVATRDDQVVGHAMWAWATLGVPEQASRSLGIPEQAGQSPGIPEQAGRSLGEPEQTGQSLGEPEQTGQSLGEPEQAGESLRVAELAAVIADEEQRRGLGVRMLALAAADAIATGATHFLFVVSAANDASLRMVRRRWPDAVAERDGTLLTFLAPARLPNQPKEPADVADQQVRRLTPRASWRGIRIPTATGWQ